MPSELGPISPGDMNESIEEAGSNRTSSGSETQENPQGSSGEDESDQRDQNASAANDGSNISSDAEREVAEILGRIFNGVNQQQTARSQGDTVSDQFNRSIDTFDGIMGQEQQATSNTGIDRTNEPAGAGEDSNEGEMSSVVGQESENTVIAGGQMNEGFESQASEQGDDSFGEGILDGYARVSAIEGCDDENIVAQQLCEAATLEEDPFLRAALWREYNLYREILESQ